MNERRLSSASSVPWRLASARRATHWVAVANWTRCPARQARIESAIARCVLPVPGRSEQDHVLAGVEEVELAEVLDHRLLHRALEGEVELLERLAGGEPGGLDPALAAVGVAGGDLGAEQHLGEPLIAPGLLAGPVSQRRQRPGGGGCFQRAEQVRELERAWSCRDQLRHSATAAGSRPRPRGAGGARRAGARAAV